MLIKMFLFVLLVLITCANSARILAGFPTDALSHLYSTITYLERLADDGHQVFVLQTGKSKQVQLKHPNMTVFYVHMELGPETDIITIVNSFLWTMTSHGFEPPIILTEANKAVHHLLDSNSDSVQQVLNAHWDLIVVEELFNPITYAIATYHKRWNKTPYIQYCSSHPLEADAIARGLGRSWASKIPMFMPIPQNLDDIYKTSVFTKRLVGFFEHFAEFLSIFAHFWTFSDIHRLGMKEFNMKYLNDYSSLYLSDLFQGFEASPVANDFLLVGAYCQQSGKLPKSLEQFVEDPRSKGTIYLAFGSLVRWSSAPENVVEAIFGALNELTDYRVIVSSKGMPATIKMASHVKILNWAPQVDILAHNKTKVFVSHGGLKSVKEAICGRTPVLFVPLFAEQAHNAVQMTTLGIASFLNKYTLSKAVVYKELKKILDTPDFQIKMDSFHSYYLDKPISDIQLASYLTNRIIKKQGEDVRHPRRGQFIGWSDYLFLPELIATMSLIYMLSRK